MKWDQVKDGDNDGIQQSIDGQPGVYVMCITRPEPGETNERLEPIYVGESKDVGGRLRTHGSGLRNLRRTFLRREFLSILKQSEKSWLSLLREQARTAIEESKYLYAVSPIENVSSDTLKEEARAFWKQLRIFALTEITDISEEATERAQRTAVEATLQELFTRHLMRGKQSPEGLPNVHLLQAPKSLFLGKRQGSIIPTLDALAMPKPLRDFLEHPKRASRRAA